MAEKRIKLNAVARELSLASMGLTGDAFRRFHAELAQKELQRVLNDSRGAAGREPYYLQFVDGRQGAALDSVKLGGVIEFTFDHIAEIATEAWELLKQLSPVDRSPDARAPAYRDHHAIFINGAEVKDLSGLKPGDEVLFANLLPYARKIEQGSSAQAPNGVYEVAQKTLRQRYGKLLYIEMTYRGFVDSAFVNPNSAAPTVKAAIKSTIKRGARGRFIKGSGFVKGSGARISGGEHNISNVRFPVLVLHPYTVDELVERRRAERFRARH
jgi:hypothetical protein